MTISAMTRQAIRGFDGHAGCGIIGEKRPVAIIIMTATGASILDIDGKDVPPEEAVRLCPEIADLLDPDGMSDAAG